MKRTSRHTILSFSLSSIFILLLYGTLPITGFAQRTLSDAESPIDAQMVRAIEIESIQVKGVSSPSESRFILQASELKMGQFVTIPGDPALTEAIRAIYRLGKYEDVKILEEPGTSGRSAIIIHVVETPRLGTYTFKGINKSHRRDLEERAPLLMRTPLREADIDRTISIIKSYYLEKGYPAVLVDVERTPGISNTVNLTFDINKGKVIEVTDISIEGPTLLSTKKIRKKLKTKEDRWWRFWKKAKFDQTTYEDDLQKMITYLNEKGYYDARILSDSMYIVGNKSPTLPSMASVVHGEITEEGTIVYSDSALHKVHDRQKTGLVLEVEIYEGPQYHIRDIHWEGNTVYSDEMLNQALGFEPGDVYNGTRLQENIYANRSSTDISSLYMNQGYMTFRTEPVIRVVEGDSLDLYFDISEGDVYEFGSIEIAGNDKTKDHVVRRELYTIPGQTFSRDAIQESIRRLMQLNYFSQESLGAGPSIKVNDKDKHVNLSYNLTETGSDQLQLSGTWASYGLVLSLGFEFNNFSLQNMFSKKAWRPLPSGDGQRLSLNVQTSGRNYQSYSIGLTEPWFRGNPTPIGTSITYTRIGEDALSTGNSGTFSSIGFRGFYEKRLKWPDDKFSLSSSIGYQLFDNDGLYSTVPTGVSREITFQQALTRNSTDHPLFPSQGSQMNLSLTIAPPITGFIQYHKWQFKNTWHLPIAKKLSLSFSSDIGYIGSLTGEDVEFQRYLVGGSPFDTQGLNNAQFLGTDMFTCEGIRPM